MEESQDPPIPSSSAGSSAARNFFGAIKNNSRRRARSRSPPPPTREVKDTSIVTGHPRHQLAHMRPRESLAEPTISQSTTDSSSSYGTSRTSSSESEFHRYKYSRHSSNWIFASQSKLKRQSTSGSCNYPSDDTYATSVSSYADGQHSIGFDRWTSSRPEPLALKQSTESKDEGSEPPLLANEKAMCKDTTPEETIVIDTNLVVGVVPDRGLSQPAEHHTSSILDGSPEVQDTKAQHSITKVDTFTREVRQAREELSVIDSGTRPARFALETDTVSPEVKNDFISSWQNAIPETQAQFADLPLSEADTSLQQKAMSTDDDGKDFDSSSLDSKPPYSRHNVLPACFETIVEDDTESCAGIVDAYQRASISCQRETDKRNSELEATISEESILNRRFTNMPLASDDMDSTEDELDANLPTFDVSTVLKDAVNAVTSQFISSVMASILTTETQSMPHLARLYTTSSNTTSSGATSSHATPMTSRNSFNSSHSGGRKRHNADDEDIDDHQENSDGRRGGQKRARSTPSNIDTNRKLACPFHQRDPQLHQRNACTGPGWPNMVRLKNSHLYRDHKRQGHHCTRCWMSFTTTTELRAHTSVSVALMCDVQEEPDDGLIRETTWEALKGSSKYAGATTEEEKWRMLYKSLFPLDTEIPSPCYASTESDVPQDRQGNTDQRIMELLRPRIEQRIADQLAPLVALLMAELPSLIEECSNEAAEQDSNRLRGGNNSQPVALDLNFDVFDPDALPSFDIAAVPPILAFNPTVGDLGASLATGSWDDGLSFTGMGTAGPLGNEQVTSAAERAHNDSTADEDHGWMAEFLANYNSFDSEEV